MLAIEITFGEIPTLAKNDAVAFAQFALRVATGLLVSNSSFILHFLVRYKRTKFFKNEQCLLN